MAKKVNIVGTQPKRVQVVDKPVRRIEPTEVAAALGAEPCGEHIGANPDPISLAELGTELLRRLRSSGGRPALVDATEYCRVPLSPNDVKALEQITAQIEQSSGTKPSPGQVASIIVREYLNGGSVNSQEASVKSPMPDSKPSLEHKLVDWLSREGYRLEYLTVEAFRAEGIDALLGYFVESTEGKQREIDVCAYTPLETFNPPIIARVFCECKYSAESPWVLLMSGLRGELFSDWISLPKSPDLRAMDARIHQWQQVLADCWHFAKEQPFAHSVVQAFKKDNRDAAYESLQKITNAAWDYVETPRRKGHASYLIVIPCLIVEAPLFVSWYDFQKDSFVVKRTPYGRLSWSGCRNGTVVDVVHASALSDYAKGVKVSFEKILSVITDMADLCR